jgi:RHS repeat-associated protein
MEMPGRDTTFKYGYRYGFNGKEMDNDPYGKGNEYDYGFRIYNPRVGRFLSVDPLTTSYPQLTPYQFASNSPVKYIDIDGKEGGIAEDEEKDPWEIWDELKANSLFNRDNPDPPPYIPLDYLSPEKETAPIDNPTDATYNANIPRFRTQTNEEINAKVFKTLDESNSCSLPDFAKNIKPITPPSIWPEKDNNNRYDALNNLQNEIVEAAKSTTYNGKSVDFRDITTYTQESGDKFIIIGRAQDARIEPFKESLQKAGVNVQTIKDDLPDGPSSPQENSNWIKNKLANGYGVIDIGLDPFYSDQGNNSQGDYYSVEKDAVNSTNFTGKAETSLPPPKQ